MAPARDTSGGELILAITDACTASCDSCPFSCGPGQCDVMDEHLADGLIDQAASLGFWRVTLAGGEPFLQPSLVRALLEHAADAGIRERAVVTNGFWGAWPGERVEDDVRALAGPLTHVAFCYDAFHAEYIDESVFWRAVRSLDGTPVEAVVRVADVRGDKGAGPFFSSLSTEALGKCYLVYPLRPQGRASGLPRECFVECPDAGGPRGWSAKATCVNWDGGAYPCDWPGIPRLSEPLGNATQAPLSDILARLGAPAPTGRGCGQWA